MAHDDFERKNLEAWTAAIANTIGKNRPVRSTWQGVQSIHDALRPFMGFNRNHTFLPTHGGHDLISVGLSAEQGCLELAVTEGMIEIVRPASVTLDYIPESPIDSFLLLELDRLQPTAVYDFPIEHREEVLELEPGEYVDREVWEQGYLRHDERGREIPLPAACRCVTRWLGGKMLIAAKASRWNYDTSTYDGRHKHMGSADIRQIIERSLTRPRTPHTFHLSPQEVV